MTNTVKGFQEHAVVAFHYDAAKYRNITGHQANWFEKVGDGIVFPTYTLPRKIKGWLHEPKVLTVLFTLGALGLNTMAFYPIKSMRAIRDGVDFVVKKLDGKQVKFASYLFVSSQILGLGVRSWGRFSNDKLMKAST